ncbi:hypothetical protein AKJ09_10725 [Labilithrix luteola]|uniref:CBS domain-containing protein n=1 Tax=Labilithrix luteola TaxID=1391654 RepID=A0A0K1QEG8_9BACT|nr:CBS domain-containing protein [Labilithrix luteola]AKV04062.1 hypothetical protein AKJ09_10725 [Labilithrix luteola]
MQDTREHKTTSGALEGDERRRFMRALLTDLRAMERMLRDNVFERGVMRIGAEQEMFLVDRAYHAAPQALKVLERLDDPHYTTELGLFNLELNADPQPLAGRGLLALETQLSDLYARVQRTAEELDILPVLVGILPTLGKTDLRIDNMVPNPRYLTLNRVMTAARGQGYDISIKGLDELVAKHDSLMFEACNASFQVHLQVAEPERFGHDYDIAQLLLAPTLAIGTNSPTLFGKRLWAETRIALFEQSCDIRTPQLHVRDRAARVFFGNQWLRGSVVDIFKENVTRFRTLVATGNEEDALATLERGGVPDLRALRLHNGTIYRWNRACYGVSENGKPHLRIELRALPAGPTIVDEVANAAFWLGLMTELTRTLEEVSGRMDFDHAKANFYAAARDGLAARFTWIDGEEVIAQPFILDKLLPLAEAGLSRAGVDSADAKRYLGIVDQRVRTLHTGSRWMLRSLANMKSRGSAGEGLTALVAATIARQNTGRPVAEWERARLDEAFAKRSGYQKVSQYMRTDVFTVQPDDPIELVSDLMSWERIRHVPVEDEAGRLLGLVTSRAVLRHLTELAKGGSVREVAQAAEGQGRTTSLPVSEVMRRELVTVHPDTATREAIELMRKHRIGCLPVVQDGRIVALLTEEDFMGIAADLLDESSHGSLHRAPEELLFEEQSES